MQNVYWAIGTILGIIALIAMVQLYLIRTALRDAPQPHWDDISKALWELHQAMHLGWLAKVTMPIGQRLWPATAKED